MRTLLFVLAASYATAAPPTVRVRVQNKVTEMPLERYAAAVLAGESSVFQSKEALKAMAVAARTYAVRMRGRHSPEGFDVCDTTHCQRVDLTGIAERLEQAVADTSGELLWFQGKPAFTPYTQDCGGRSEDAASVWPDLASPYLRSHPDAYCSRGEHAYWRWSADAHQIQGALTRSQLRTPRVLERISILERTASGRASILLLAGGGESVRISAGSFRFAMGREIGWETMRGDRYEVHVSAGRFAFEGEGAGHGVGLCQRGAEQMGLAGKTYREILAFYYPGTSVGRMAAGLSWSRLSGDSMVLFTANPDRDKIALTAAERIQRDLVPRLPWTPAQGVELRVYPDLDSYRNATGEPGWVAAHTQGRVIHLQPVEVLQRNGALDSTLRHELLHAAMNARAAAGLPVWFREGLVEYLESPRLAATAQIPADRDLRQLTEPDQAREAYAQALLAVTKLVRTYGETTVLGWVEMGLPPEISRDAAKPTASQPNTKSK